MFICPGFEIFVSINVSRLRRGYARNDVVRTKQHPIMSEGKSVSMVAFLNGCTRRQAEKPEERDAMIVEFNLYARTKSDRRG